MKRGMNTKEEPCRGRRSWEGGSLGRGLSDRPKVFWVGVDLEKEKGSNRGENTSQNTETIQEGKSPN